MEFGSDVIGVMRRHYSQSYDIQFLSEVFLCLVSFVLHTLDTHGIQFHSGVFLCLVSFVLSLSLCLFFFAPFFPSLIDGSHFHHIHPHSYAIARICGVLLACTCGLRRLRRSTISGLWNKRTGTWMLVGVFDCLKSLSPLSHCIFLLIMFLMVPYLNKGGSP